MRARKQLRPETFPFLAVLLCAMGSLILLLLVMDRRAKAVARAKAEQALARALEEQDRANAAVQEEWERRRQALHADLEEQDEDVRQQLRAAQDRVIEAAAKARAEEDRWGELRRQVEREEARLSGSEEELAERRARVAEAEHRTQAARAELAALTGELTKLERTLADLKAARQRAQQTYSVVPYRGKRGENRRPLYVECTAAGLVFHPDKQALADAGLTAEAVRSEVERRVARQREALAKAGAPTDRTAYLLFLVRPDGIPRYYQAIGALRGLEIDFGYEFIDRDWLLDFPEDDGTPARQPWVTAESDKVPPPAADFGRAAPSGVNGRAPRGVRTGGTDQGTTGGVEETRAGQPLAGLPGVPRQPGPGSAGVRPAAGGVATSPGQGAVPGTAGASAPGGAGASGSQVGVRGPGSGMPSSQGSPGGAGMALGVGAPAGGGPPAPGGAGSAASGALGQAGVDSAPGSRRGRGPRGVMLSPPGKEAGGGTELSDGVGMTPASPGGEGVPTTGGGGAVGALSSFGSTPGTTGTGPSRTGGTAVGLPPLGAASTGSGRGGGSGSSGGDSGNGTATISSESGVQAGTASSDGTPKAGPAAGGSPGSSFAGGRPASGAASTSGGGGPGGSTSGAGGASDHTGSGGGGDAGGETGGQSSGPRLKIGPFPSGDTAKRPPQARPFRLVGNRDWFLLVECTRDTLVLYPGGKRFSAQAVAAEPQSARAIQEAVRGMIARRQAMVRPGEPPYRPQIRFLVRPDGLRTFYLAYPVLEPVQVPMTRQNLDADEEIK